jgi:hypothetical protein
MVVDGMHACILFIQTQAQTPSPRRNHIDILKYLNILPLIGASIGLGETLFRAGNWH